MAVPKKKMSRSRTRRRKAQWKVARPTISRCPSAAPLIFRTVRAKPVARTRVVK